MDECLKLRLRLSDEFKQLKRVFTALGDETRQQIFIALLENESVGIRVPEITERTHLSRQAVSHHLQILKKSGLVNMYQKGRMNFYYVDDNQGFWQSLKDLFDHVNRVVSLDLDLQSKILKSGGK